MTEITPSSRPADTVQLGAVRLLCLVCHFGEDDAAAQGGPTLWGERRLQELDHLLRHPDQLALLLMDRVLASGKAVPSSLAEGLRGLLRANGGGRAPRRLEVPPWRTADDTLAFLTCRNLLRLASRPRGGQTERGFVATEDGVDTLSSLSAKEGMARLLRERCRLLGQVIPPGASLDLDSSRERLAGFLQDENLATEDDPAPRLFHLLFDQRL